MTIWIGALFFFFNFCMGVLLPIVPNVAPERAGIAFSAFSLFKVAYLFVGGAVSDAIGHSRAFLLCLLFQGCALLAITMLPSQPWLGRVLEGAALAQGTVSAISLFRQILPDRERFGRVLGRLLGVGSVGFIFGPLVGYSVLGSARFSANDLLRTLALLAFALLSLHLLFFARGVRATPGSEDGATGEGATGRRFRLIGFAAGKVLGIGLQPLIAWWATRQAGLSPLLAGASFLLLGVSFGLGASMQKLARKKPFALLGVVGLVALELALHRVPFAWWIALLSFGSWFGAFATSTSADLGWSDPSGFGRSNARWMGITDLPMAVTPILLWPFRDTELSVVRPGFFFGVFAVAILFSFWRMEAAVARTR